MRSIDNVHHAIAAALTERIDLSQLVVTAWRAGEVSKLDAAVVRALGVSNPDTILDDIIPGAIVGSTVAIIGAHTRDARPLIDGEDMDEMVTEFAALIQRATKTKSKEFLAHACQQIHAAIGLVIAARLDCVGLEERYKKTPIDQALSLIVEVADYYRDYKAQSGLIDAADMLVSELEPIPGCALALLDPVGMPLLALQALRHLLPRAFFCYVRLY